MSWSYEFWSYEMNMCTTDGEDVYTVSIINIDMLIE